MVKESFRLPAEQVDVAKALVASDAYDFDSRSAVYRASVEAFLDAENLAAIADVDGVDADDIDREADGGTDDGFGGSL
jgi:Arc/MetJ-type ribon-helix-helix transcriptional regulator